MNIPLVFSARDAVGFGIDMGLIPTSHRHRKGSVGSPPSTAKHPVSRVPGPHGAILALQQQPRQQSHQHKSVPYALNRPVCFEGGSPGNPKLFGPQPQGCRDRGWHSGLPREVQPPWGPLAAPPRAEHPPVVRNHPHEPHSCPCPHAFCKARARPPKLHPSDCP